MRHLLDITIALGLILGATGIVTGHRWLGGISLLIALTLGWKRNWCIESFYDLMGSSEQSSGNEVASPGSEAVHGADTASSSESSAPD